MQLLKAGPETTSLFHYKNKYLKPNKSGGVAQIFRNCRFSNCVPGSNLYSQLLYLLNCKCLNVSKCKCSDYLPFGSIIVTKKYANTVLSVHANCSKVWGVVLIGSFDQILA